MMRIIRKAFKIILSILIIVTFMLSNNQFSFADPGNIIVTINSDITSGTLQTEVELQAGEDNAAQVNELHITGGGALNNTDIAYINTMINLEVLNVASTVIVGNVGDNFCSSFNDSGNIPDFDNLREVTFPATEFGDNAFKFCPSLENLNLPNVTSFGNNALFYCNSRVSVNLPNVTSFGDEAFYSCAALETIELPKATTFGDYAFNHCTRLETIELPKATTFGDHAFYQCRGLETIELPEATTFGDYAFYGCEILMTVNLANAISFGDYAFSNCNILESVHLPKVTSFGTSTFNGTNNIDSLILGEVPPTVGGWGLLQSSPTRTVYVPSEKVLIYDNNDSKVDNEWHEIWSIERVDLVGPVTIFTINEGNPEFNETPQYNKTLIAMVGCTNNTEILSYQWKQDGIAINGATSNTYVVTEDDINKSIIVEVTSSIKSGEITSTSVTPSKADYTGPIVDPALESKSHNSITLTEVTGYEYSRDSGANWQDSNVFAGLDADTTYSFIQRVKETATHKVSSNSNIQNIKTDEEPLVVRIETDITSGTLQTEVEAQAGAGNGNIVNELHITAGGALNNTDIAYINTMINLEVLNVASTVIVGNVGDNFCSSFNDSGNIPDFDNLREVTFPATEFGDNAFKFCSSLENLNLPNVTSFGNNALFYCNSRVSVNLPNVTSFGDEAFYSCAALETIELPKATTFGDYAFNHCTRLETIELPKATTFGDHALYQCRGLETIELPEATTFGDSAFYGCEILMTVNLANAISFGDYAFSNCNILESVHLPKVTSFGTSTFNGTNNIDSLILGEVPPTVGGWGTLQPSPTRAVYVPAVAMATYDSATPPSDDNIWKGWLIKTFELYGVVSIDHDGSPQFGETITANLIDSNNTGNLSYQWKRGSMNIGSDSASYTIVEADIGSILTVEVSSSEESGTIVSSPFTPDKADYSGSVADPLEDSKSHNSITLTEVNGYEYKESNGNWQDSNIFTGLTADTVYTFIQRVKATVTHNASVDSNPLDIITDTALVDAETPVFTNNLTDQAGQVGNTITLDATATVSDGGTISYQWYKVDDKSKSNPQALAVTEATHIANPTSAAISFYYCEVTNTNNSVNGNTVVTVDSNVAKVTITSGVPSTKSMTSYNPVTLTQTGDIANGNVQYQTANEVISVLPTDITVTLEDGSTSSVAVSWTDTDGYDATTAGNYTFTATWGVLPSGVDNDDNISAPTSEIKVVKGSTGGGSSSNNSGSSGNNGQTSADTPTPTYQVDVSGIGIPSNSLSVNVDANAGNAEVDLGSISGKVFDKEGVALVTIPSIPNVTDYTLKFPTVTESTSQGQSSLTFSTDAGSITIPDNMFSNIPGVEGKKPSITIGQGDKANLSEEEREAIGDRPLVQLTLNLDGKQARWNNPNAPVTVSIPYTPTAMELLDPEHIVIWYIDGEGNVISVPSGRYNPTMGTVTFDTTHFSYYAVAYAKKIFSDLNGVEWARKPIEVMASKGIINGTSTTTFSPLENITRSDYLVLLINTLGLTADFDSNFDDVTPSDYYYEALGISKELGISAGIGNNFFNPKGNISRQDMIVMTARALEKFQDLKTIKDTTVLDRFSDKGEISSYAIESLATMVKEGLISGSGDKLKPHAYSTRAEAAVFLYRIYNK